MLTVIHTDRNTEQQKDSIQWFPFFLCQSLCGVMAFKAFPHEVPRMSTSRIQLFLHLPPHRFFLNPLGLLSIAGSSRVPLAAQVDQAASCRSSDPHTSTSLVDRHVPGDTVDKRSIQQIITKCG